MGRVPMTWKVILPFLCPRYGEWIERCQLVFQSSFFANGLRLIQD